MLRLTSGKLLLLAVVIVPLVGIGFFTGVIPRTPSSNPTCEIRRNILAMIEENRDQEHVGVLVIAFVGADDAARKAGCPDCRALKGFRGARDSFESSTGMKPNELLRGSIPDRAALGVPALQVMARELGDATKVCWR